MVLQSGPSNQPVLTQHYDNDVRVLDETTPSYAPDWNSYESEPQTTPTDSTAGIERSLSPYSSNQNLPHGSSPAPDEAPPTTSSVVESTETAPPSDLDLRMANLQLTKTLPDSTVSSYPLTTAVITSALSRTHTSLEPVREHHPSDSYPQHDTRSTLSYSNSEFKYAVQTTVAAHHYANIRGPDVRTVASQNVTPIPSISRGNDSLQERKARLQQELQMLEIEEHKQQAQRWSGPKTSYPPPPPTAVGPRVGYEGGGSPHHSGLMGPVPGSYSTGPPVGYHHSSGSGGSHYSPHSTMTHQYLAQQQPTIRDYQVSTVYV